MLTNVHVSQQKLTDHSSHSRISQAFNKASTTYTAHSQVQLKTCNALIALLKPYLFHQQNLNFYTFVGVAIYFLITTTIPMISILEAPIRAAIALIVFQNSGISNSALALSSVLIWIINIIIPSIYGYTILLKHNFDFKIFGKQK